MKNKCDKKNRLEESGRLVQTNDGDVAARVLVAVVGEERSIIGGGAERAHFDVALWDAGDLQVVADTLFGIVGGGFVGGYFIVKYALIEAGCVEFVGVDTDTGAEEAVDVFGF